MAKMKLAGVTEIITAAITKAVKAQDLIQTEKKIIKKIE